MTPTINRLNTTSHPARTPPTVGEISSAAQSENLQAILANLPRDALDEDMSRPEDSDDMSLDMSELRRGVSTSLRVPLRPPQHNDDYDNDNDSDSDEDDLDLDLDMLSMSRDLSRSIGVSEDGRSTIPTPPGQPSQSAAAPDLDAMEDLDLNLDSLQIGPAANPTSTPNDIIQEEPAEQEPDEEESKKNPLVIIIAAAIIIAVVVVIIIFSNFSTQPQSTAPQQDSQSAVTTREQYYQNDQLTETDSGMYQDSMVISKYITIVDDSCLLVFEGYAENARAFIRAYVDLETYNRYKTGARVSVVYKRITIQKTDYYMEVQII